MTDDRRRTDFVTQRELFDAMTALTKEEREDRHDLRNQMTVAISNLDSNIDTRLRAVELGLTKLQTATDGRSDPEARIRSLETSRDEIRGALNFMRFVVGLSAIVSAVVAVVEFFQVVHP